MNRNRFAFWNFAPLAFTIFCLSPLSAIGADAERTSKNTPRLAQWLEKYPQADTNKDGVLTFAEAVEYRKLIAKRQPKVVRQPDESDVVYGPHMRHRLDFYRAKPSGATPVLVWFHGGGFVHGDKLTARVNGLARQCLASGISVVGANYRFVRRASKGKPAVSMPTPLLDGARVVQFLRTKDKEWNLDPQRIVVAGSSAGGVMALWIGMHDDLADADSDDPVSRQSSRIAAAISYGGPTTLVPREILKHVGGHPTIHPSLQPCFDVASVEEMDDPEKHRLALLASPITHLSKGDPPMYLRYGGKLTDTPLPADTSIGVSIHHANFARLLYKQCLEQDVECDMAVSGHKAKSNEIGFLKQVFEAGK